MTAALGMMVTKVTQIKSRIKKLVEDRDVREETKRQRVKKTDK